jgi:hypothetical protein
MTASLKKAATSKNPMYLEGVKRMYGASRLTAAKKATASQGTSRVSPRVAERASATASRTSPRVAERKVTKSAPAKKTSKTTDPIARFVFGVGRAAAEPFKSKK